MIASSSSARVVSLGDLRRTDVATAGGKAANLGDLLAAGFPVPPGFAVLTAAYEEFVDGAGIAQQLADLVAERVLNSLLLVDMSIV